MLHENIMRAESARNAGVPPVMKLFTAAAGEALADAHRIANAMGYASAYAERVLADAGPDVR